MITIALTPVPIPPNGVPVTRQQNTQFANDYAILAAPNLSSVQRKTIRILGLIYSLNNVRGADYRNNIPQLAADAAAYTNGISNFDLDTALAVSEWSNGYNADATLTTDVNAILKLQPSLQARPEQELDRMIALLELRLAR